MLAECVQYASPTLTLDDDRGFIHFTQITEQKETTNAWRRYERVRAGEGNVALLSGKTNYSFKIIDSRMK